MEIELPLNVRFLVKDTSPVLETSTVPLSLSVTVTVIRAGLIPAVPLPPWMAVVSRNSNVVAEPQLAVKTIHGCIVLTNALRRNKGY